jgi:xanthine/CO dehydrogenase XdhC/CoxF family maturation factor
VAKGNRAAQRRRLVIVSQAEQAGMRHYLAAAGPMRITPLLARQARQTPEAAVKVAATMRLPITSRALAEALVVLSGRLSQAQAQHIFMRLELAAPLAGLAQGVE